MYFKSILVSLPSVYAILCVLGCGFFAGIIVAAELQSATLSNVLRADFRHRPPEMVLDERTNTMTSPLKDILEEAAAKVGYRVEWSARPFARSIHELRVGTVDIVPRTIRRARGICTVSWSYWHSDSRYFVSRKSRRGRTD
ncbi:hypothetical protein N5094_03425 [Shewanella putrefaciens]|uniref:hypothetical protein n=1 Tax=Shewanella putrefaciens TaxID=24 RepID=UPI0021C1A33A|nr:hypothetical protein [Shewanella putrefaciens]UXK09300.1 hypothetical protein N5094_03425 [Shewanella putrefaciens]